MAATKTTKRKPGRPKKPPSVDESVDLLGKIAKGSKAKPEAKTANGKEQEEYGKSYNSNLARKNALAAKFRDIGPIPPPKNPERRAKAIASFQAFCELYHSNTFCLKWSPDHLKAISKIEKAVDQGELFALAMPRGSGKTSLSVAACEWAVLTGRRKYVCLICADEDSAKRLLDNMGTDFETNDLLLEDFPEVCFPIRAMDGIHQRANGQASNGKRTRIEWTATQLVLPTVFDEEGSMYSSSTSIIDVSGLTGRIRGKQRKHPVTGEVVRPDLVLVDDPQSDESARSPSQVQTRLKVLMGAVLNLAGPGKKISGLAAVTVICPNDLADRLLDVEKFPQWQGERTKLLYAWPKNMDLWKQYAKARIEGMVAGRGLADATEFYGKNRAKMDEGAIAAWEERFNPDEISAVQNAMNLHFQDESSFLSEYQNDPLPNVASVGATLDPDSLLRRTNNIPRGVAPEWASKITGFIDVQGKLLYWLLVAWDDDLAGHVIDYGCYPEQHGRKYSTLADSRNTLQLLHPEAGTAGQLTAGLKVLCKDLMTRRIETEDEMKLNVSRLLIDANWGQSRDAVYEFIYRSEFAERMNPSHGRYVGASSIPFSDYKKKRGDRVGLGWRIPKLSSDGKRNLVRYVLYDTNYWKTWTAERLTATVGDPGGMTFFEGRPEDHQMFVDQLCAEYRVQTAGRGRTLEEWKLKPDRPDNHLFDCLVGSAVAASMEGAGKTPFEVMVSNEKKKAKSGQKVSFAERQKTKKSSF